jgi:predicted nucleic acid-binding protein
MIALDTNVLIYRCDEGDPGRQKIALDLVAETMEASCRGRLRASS